MKPTLLALTLALCASTAMAAPQTMPMKDGKPCHKTLAHPGKRPPMKPMDMGMMHGMPMPMGVKGVDNAESKALVKANMDMHKGMDITYTGDADIDFLRGMIAHHQGAVDMAQVQLQYGKDQQVRRMAMEIIRNQNLEIKWMQGWLKQLEAKGAQRSPDQPTHSRFHDSAWAGATWLNER